MQVKKDQIELSVLPVSRFGAYREYIGSVCVQWSFLELNVERVLAYLKDGSNVLGYENQIGNNVKTLRKLVPDSALDDAEKVDLLGVLVAIEGLYEERHRIVHGLWGFTNEYEVYSIHISTQKKKRRVIVPGRSMTLEDIRNFKLEVVRVRRRLGKFIQGDEIIIADEAAET